MFDDVIAATYQFPVDNHTARTRKNPAYKNGNASALRILRVDALEYAIDPCREKPVVGGVGEKKESRIGKK